MSVLCLADVRQHGSRSSVPRCSDLAGTRLSPERYRRQKPHSSGDPALVSCLR